MNKTTLSTVAALALVCGGHAEDAKQNPKEVVEKLLDKSREAKAAGRYEEAEKLHAQAEKIAAELKGKEGIKHKEGEKGKEAPKHKDGEKEMIKKPEGVKFAGKGPEAERLHHIMQAVEHLHAGGMHEQANAINEAAQHMRRELEEQMKRQQAEAHGKEGKPPGDKKGQAEVEELRQQIRKMAEQIEHLQGELKKRGS